MMSNIKTRAKGEVLEPGLIFPPSNKFCPPSQLPTNSSIIRMMTYFIGKGGSGQNGLKAANEVAKNVYAKYFHDTVYCVSLPTIARRVLDMWTTYHEGQKRLPDAEKREKKGKSKREVVVRYEYLVKRRDELFDVYAHDEERKRQVEQEWGVKMGPREHLYYQDQKGSRSMDCNNGVDPVWYHAHMRVQRERERKEHYQRQREEDFSFKSLDAITTMLRHQGEILTDSADEDTTSMQSWSEEDKPGPSGRGEGK